MQSSAGAISKVAPGDLSFETIVQFLDFAKKSKYALRKKALSQLINSIIDRSSRSAYDVFRLIIPSLDLERGNYFLLESSLVNVLLQAAGISRNDPLGKAARNWKSPSMAAQAGVFPDVMQSAIFNNVCFTQPRTEGARRLKVKDINKMLDDIAQAGKDYKKKAEILRGIMQRATSRQMYWITQIILKKIHFGIGDKSILKEWHPSALKYYNNAGMDLKAVFNDITEYTQLVSTSIQPGKPIRPQLAVMTTSASSAYKRMCIKKESKKILGPPRPFIVETKFDGERIQVHRCQDGRVLYYSRKAIEHGARSNYSIMNEAIKAATGENHPCILDGEMVVWNKTKHVFEPFGTIKSTVIAALNGVSPQERLQVEDFFGVLKSDVDPDYVPPTAGVRH